VSNSNTKLGLLACPSANVLMHIASKANNFALVNKLAKGLVRFNFIGLL
jgi:hypothetical protein